MVWSVVLASAASLMEIVLGLTLGGVGLGAVVNCSCSCVVASCLAVVKEEALDTAIHSKSITFAFGCVCMCRCCVFPGLLDGSVISECGGPFCN